MPDQLTIRLPPDLRRALDEEAKRTQRKSADLVRMALRAFLAIEAPSVRPASRVRDLLGSVDSGVPDLAERHREHVLEAIRHGR